MKYYAIDFKIEAKAELLPIVRELLPAVSAEAQLEAWDEGEGDTLRGYAQQDLLDRPALDAALANIMPGVHVSYTVSQVEDKNWNQAWEEEGFEPIAIDNKLVVTDARRDDAQAADGRIHVLIHAENAFGTGTHETTRMVLTALCHMDLQGKRILDCGCGTGILGIAAAKMGAEEVVGYDIDEWSVENMRKNAELNGVSNLQVLHGDAHVLSHVCGLFDVVVANINRNILVADLPSLKDVMSGKAELVLSGFYTADVPVLLEAAEALDMHEVERFEEDEWCCLHLKLG